MADTKCLTRNNLKEEGYTSSYGLRRYSSSWWLRHSSKTGSHLPLGELVHILVGQKAWGKNAGTPPTLFPLSTQSENTDHIESTTYAYLS